MEQTYFKIGKFVATHGYKGELLLKHHLGKKTTLKGVKAVFIEEKKQSFIPWFIETATVKTEEEVILKIEGLDARETAARLTQKEVWLTEADFKKQSSRDSALNFLGYQIVEGDRVLGTVEEVIEQPHQILCRINLAGKEAFIPLHEETLIKMDQKKRQIIVALPPGLLEIYL